MTTYHDLTGFQRDLLEAIAAVADDPYGLALKDYLDELDARTNVYTLTDAGRHELQRQAETLAGLCELPRPVAGGVFSNAPETHTVASNSGQKWEPSRPVLSEARDHWAGDYRLVPYWNICKTST